MLRSGTLVPDQAGISTIADVHKELHRLRESQMLLVLMAEELGLEIPRSCCPHPGQCACAPCAATWLAGKLPQKPGRKGRSAPVAP